MIFFFFIAPNYCKLWRNRAAKLAIKLSALSCLNRASPGLSLPQPPWVNLQEGRRF